jgi:hypothetical protein
MKTGLMAGGIALLATLGLSFMAFAGPSVDSDGDGVYDVLDNCKDVPNAPAPADCDTDNDGYGNMCDGDYDEDAFVLTSDYDLFYADLNGTGYDSGIGSDMDCDGYVLTSDYDIFYSYLNGSGAPGPSGLSCAGTVPCDL